METDAMKERLRALLELLRDIEATTPYRLVRGRTYGDWLFVASPVYRDDRHPASVPSKGRGYDGPE